jgi:hypothetical protein
VGNSLRIRPGIFGRSVGRHDAGYCLGDGFPVSGKVIGRASRVEAVAKVFVELCEQRVHHRQTYAVDGTLSPGVGSERCQGPHPIWCRSPAPASNSPSGTSSTIEYSVCPAKRFLPRLGSHPDGFTVVPS